MIRRHLREIGVLAALLLVLAALGIWAPAFYSPQPLLSLAAREAPTLIVAAGVALVIICREIDISVGSIFSVCSVVAGLAAARGWPLVGVLGVAIATGVVLGAVNGVLVGPWRLPSIVVTLATMVTLRQGLNLVRQGEFVNLPPGVQWFGLSQTGGQWLLIGATLVFIVGLALVLQYGIAGRLVYAVGSNAEAARLAGIRPRLVTFNVFVLTGAFTGLAAMMNLVQSPQVQPLTGNGLELKVIAAVVVGGVAISGGRGNLWGVLIGLLLLACVTPALTYLRIEAFWEKAIQGAIILLAVVTDGVREREGGVP